MNAIGSRKQLLEEKVCELETTLGALKAQLQREIEDEQHAAIDKLEKYLDELDNKHANLQDFWKILRDEIISLFSGNSAHAKKED